MYLQNCYKKGSFVLAIMFILWSMNVLIISWDRPTIYLNSSSNTYDGRQVRQHVETIDCKLDKSIGYPPFINMIYMDSVASEYKHKYINYNECMNTVCKTPYNILTGVNWELDPVWNATIHGNNFVNNLSSNLLWNDNIRFEPIPNIMNKNVKIIIEIGCNLGMDSRRLLRKYSNAILICFEPIKILHENRLNKLVRRHNGRYIVIYKGISSKDEENMTFFKLKSDKIGESIALWTKQDLNELNLSEADKYDIFSCETIKPSIMINDIINRYNLNTIDILHMNCEGCEAIVIPDLIHSNMIQKIDNIIFGTHCFKWIKPSPQHVWCNNHLNLYKAGYIPLEIPRPCAWERWQKDKNRSILI